MSYTVNREYEGLYHVYDDEDGERVARVAKFLPGPMVYVRGQQGMYPPQLARAVARAMVMLADELECGEGTRFIEELTVKQVKAAALWLHDDEDADPRARFYRLADGSIDVHQSDAHANIEPDGRNNG